MNAEQQRLQQADWKKWGPYLSERQWGTVREDYSYNGDAWTDFPHEQARSRAYRWGEDGIAGISDSQQLLCFAIAAWNQNDLFLKERLFGLTGHQGNHGEDVKEYYFYLDNTPSHAWMQYLYKYPHREYPYQWLEEENAKRRDSEKRGGREFELLDTGLFSENRYFDIFIEYAKVDTDDILIQIRAINRGSESHSLHLLPTLWFRNTWSWDNNGAKPRLSLHKQGVIAATHPALGDYWLYCQNNPEIYFTENETNLQRLYNVPNPHPYVKDGIHDRVIANRAEAVNPEAVGTKAAPHYCFEIAPGETAIARLRLSKSPDLSDPFGSDFEATCQQRKAEADRFYQDLVPEAIAPELQHIQRQAFAGMLWTKQFYNYNVSQWLQGDPATPPPPPERQHGRNSQWQHLDNQDIISMPDKWEYPWYAVWDLAFHCQPLGQLDIDFAKEQLDVVTREWYMHPNGQVPAYEWDMGDVNPPVHAWGVWRIYQLEKQQQGQGDRLFLERVFQKLLLNFTWWVNRKDSEGNNIFEGGFLGLDNIGVFNRSEPLPTGGYLEQADGTSWMAIYCINMLAIALELATENPVYEDMATKFFEHFIYIADAMTRIGGEGGGLWDNEDGFFYDFLDLPDGQRISLKVRSMVGLIPLFATTILEPELLEKVPGFKERLEWFIQNRPQLKRNVACMETRGMGARRMLALCYVTYDRLEPSDRFRRILEKLLDEREFLSDYGIRALSKVHLDNPYVFYVGDREYRVDYEPGESSTGLFGGNSNWRGPIWFPVNFLIIEALQTYHSYLGDNFKIECPTGSGNWMNLWDVSMEISRRLISIFARNQSDRRPLYGDEEIFQSDPNWRELVQFSEYFHGDDGRGLGSSHQTGWTGLIATLISQYSHDRSQKSA